MGDRKCLRRQKEKYSPVNAGIMKFYWTEKSLLFPGKSWWDVFFDDDAKYFEGAVFSKRDSGYELDGTAELSKKEFQERVSSFSEIF